MKWSLARAASSARESNARRVSRTGRAIATVDSTWTRALDSSRLPRQCAGVRTLIAVALVLTLAHTARADLGMDVRAQATVSMELVVSAEGTRVGIRLVDDLGAPIAGGRVSVVLDATPASCASTLSLTSRRDGSAHAIVPRACTVRGAFARFEGDASYEAHETALRAEQARTHLDVRLAAEHPEHIDLDGGTLLVHLGASPADLARGRHVLLVDELARTLATATLSEGGEAMVEVDTRALGAPGPGTLAARIIDADGIELGRAEIPVVRFRAVHVSLEARVREIETEIAGEVRDAKGPIGAATVSVLASGVTLASAVSDVHGRFSVRLGSDRWPRGKSEIEIFARYVADRPGREDTDSRTLTLIAPGSGSHFDVRYTIPVVFAVFAFLIARRKKRAEPEQVAPEPKSMPVIEHVTRGSIAPWAPRVSDLGVVVLDRRDDTPIEGATVVVRAHGDEIARQTTDAEGRVRFDALADGTLDVTAESSAHAPERFTMKCPHKGEWSAVRVRIETFRAKARRALEPVAERVLTPPATFADATLREIELASGARGPRVESELVAAIEVAAYGASGPTAEEVARFDDAVRTLTASFPEAQRSPLR